MAAIWGQGREPRENNKSPSLRGKDGISQPSIMRSTRSSASEPLQEPYSGYEFASNRPPPPHVLAFTSVSSHPAAQYSPPVSTTHHHNQDFPELACIDGHFPGLSLSCARNMPSRLSSNSHDASSSTSSLSTNTHISSTSRSYRHLRAPNSIDSTPPVTSHAHHPVQSRSNDIKDVFNDCKSAGSMCLGPQSQHGSHLTEQWGRNLNGKVRGLS